MMTLLLPSEPAYAAIWVIVIFHLFVVGKYYNQIKVVLEGIDFTYQINFHSVAVLLLVLCLLSVSKTTR